MAEKLPKTSVQKGDGCIIVTTRYRDSKGHIRVKVRRIPL